MEIQIDCETLINAVKKRTPLYDTTETSYHDRILKKKLWNEVCQEVFSSSVWNSLSNLDKTKHRNEVLKRWASLRHCFRRELITQKNVSAGIIAKMKKKYIYFDSLLFLLPFAGIVNTVQKRKRIITQNEPSVSKPRMVQNIKDEEKTKPKTINMNEDDDDELFLRSLLPYMKEFSGDQKLLLRMEVIQSILNFKHSLEDNSSYTFEEVIIDEP